MSHNEEFQDNARGVDSRFLGYDELNLAEFPLASISERFLDGTKTVVFDDTVWDRKEKRWLPRKLTISGSDRFGLPTAKDDDVLLACIQLSSFSNFSAREVTFSRYELLKFLRWKDETRNYRRLATSLRRWKGLSIYSDRAFFDKSRQSWVDRDFGVIDNLYIYEAESEERASAPASSWFVWNEVLLESFQAGYLKRLDWDLYCQLESAVAKRLFRFLDKRFYHGNHVEIDLHELALRKVRLSNNYNAAEMKRVLLRGIEELESKWDLKPLQANLRFTKEARGKWTVHFERRNRKKAKPQIAKVPPQHDSATLAVQLTKRSIGPAVAEELVEASAREDVRTAIELHDWYNGRGQERGPGFLVNCIKNPSSIRLPKGFVSQVSIAKRKQTEISRNRAERDLSRRQLAKRAAADEERLRPFRDFWSALGEEHREQFESEAIQKTDTIKRQAYFRAMGSDDRLFEVYRQTILREYFERAGGEASKASQN